MSQSSDPSVWRTADVFIAWERLRIRYNAILAAVTVLSCGPFALLTYSNRLIEMVAWANVCFCVGPVAEGYAALTGFDRKPIRLFLFIAGSATAACFTATYARMWAIAFD